MRWIGVFWCLTLLGLSACQEPSTQAASATSRVQTAMVVPAYDGAGAMLRPEGYRHWVFVGASLGLRYPDDGEPVADEGPGTFHNVYVQPEAYAHYMDKGVFPEKTILAMETYETGTREPKSNLTGGYFEKELSGFATAVKDSEHFETGWAYFSFNGSGSGLADKARAFPKERCYDCHSEHAANDNVFTQFYPILKR